MDEQINVKQPRNSHHKRICKDQDHKYADQGGHEAQVEQLANHKDRHGHRYGNRIANVHRSVKKGGFQHVFQTAIRTALVHLQIVLEPKTSRFDEEVSFLAPGTFVVLYTIELASFFQHG